MSRQRRPMVHADELYLDIEDLGMFNSPKVPRKTIKLPPDEVFYLSGAIGEPKDYVDMIHTIRFAEEESQITIYINSPGGDLYTCLQVVNAIENSRAEVMTILDGEASSAAAIIWLAGHKKALSSEHVTLMLHQAGWSMYGKQSEHETQTKIMKVTIQRLLDAYCTKGLLSDDEISDLNKGLDIYLHGSQIIERLKADLIASEEAE